MFVGWEVQLCGNEGLRDGGWARLCVTNVLNATGLDI